MRLGAAAAAAQASAPGELLRRGAGEDAAGDCGALGVHPVLLAACNAAEHGAWRKQLQGCANAAHAAALAARRHETVPLLMATESCFEAGVPGARTRTRLVRAFSALPVDQGFRWFGAAGSQCYSPAHSRESDPGPVHGPESACVRVARMNASRTRQRLSVRCSGDVCA